MKLRRYKITSKEIDNGKSIIRVWALDEVDALMRVFPSEWPELHATLEFLPDIERVNGIKNA